jgi:hypothetical protein
MNTNTIHSCRCIALVFFVLLFFCFTGLAAGSNQSISEKQDFVKSAETAKESVATAIEALNQAFNATMVALDAVYIALTDVWNVSIQALTFACETWDAAQMNTTQ